MLKIAVFADFHYKKRMYASKVSDLQQIMDRAAENNVDFVLHAGDFCNDYAGSPELMNAYLKNTYNLPVYGVYGNHELENNFSEFVKPRLCNREVNFAGDDLAYWYTDINGYRLIGLDTNYFYNEETQAWVHNLDKSHGPARGSKIFNALGPEQLEWFEGILADTKAKGMKAIVVSHCAFGGECYQSPDAAKVRELYAKYDKTVILSLSGHLHTDRFSVQDNVAYFDFIATINACWSMQENFHYDDSHTFEFHDYDENGNEISVTDMKFNDLRQGKNTWFLKDPMSAIVTIDDDGTITVEGAKTEWSYGIIPPFSYNGLKSEVSDRKVKIEL